MSGPLGYCVHLVSTVPFVFGNEEEVMPELTKVRLLHQETQCWNTSLRQLPKGFCFTKTVDLFKMISNVFMYVEHGSVVMLLIFQWKMNTDIERGILLLCCRRVVALWTMHYKLSTALGSVSTASRTLRPSRRIGMNWSATTAPTGMTNSCPNSTISRLVALHYALIQLSYVFHKRFQWCIVKCKH